MRFSLLAIAMAITGLSLAYEGCNICTNNSTEPIVQIPAPWTLKGTVYSIVVLPSSTALPVKAFSPLERKSQVQSNGKYVGILGMIQIIRYTDGPVGPYDELLVVPGYFEYDRDGNEGKVERQTRVRISRIYVSQKYSCFNGRTSEQYCMLRKTQSWY